MDFNGGQAAGAVPDPLEIGEVCADVATFGELGVGPCEGALYKFPVAAKSASYASAVISDSGGPTITVDGTNETITLYWLGLGPSNLNVPQGEYLVADLVKQIQDQFNALGAATNVFSMWVGQDGHVNLRFTPGDQATLVYTRAGCIVDLGAGPAGGGPISFGANVTNRFPLLPTTTGSNQKSEWMNYKFNQAGDQFQGDLSILGSLEVHTLVSDIQVQDPLINLNINGAGDSNSAGVVLNSFNNTRWGGLIKADSGSDFHLFANSATTPTAIGWTPESTGNLFLSKLGAGTAIGTAQMDVKSASINTIPLVVDSQVGHNVNLQEWNVNGSSQAYVSQTGEIVANKLAGVVLDAVGPITFGSLPNKYTMPPARGTDGDVLITDALGNVSWGNASQIVSPDATAEVNADNGEITAVLNSIQRLFIGAGTSDLVAPSGVSKIRALDDRIETNIRIKCLADMEVSGKAFVGQLIGGAQSNVFSVLNNRVGLCVDMPLAATALNTVFAKNNVPVATIDNDGKAFFPVVSTQSIDGAAAAPLVIGDTTATSVDVSKSLATTNIKGLLKVDEASRLEGGASVGAIATGWTLPSIRATTQGQVLSTDGLGNASWTGSILYSTDINCEAQTSTIVIASSTYYPVLGAATAVSAGFTVTAGQAEATYTGLENIVVACYGGLSATSENLPGGDVALFRMAIFKNGAKLAGFSTTQFDSTTIYPQEMSIMRTISLSTGDTISLRISNETNTRNLVVSNYTLTAHKIGH